MTPVTSWVSLLVIAAKALDCFSEAETSRPVSLISLSSLDLYGQRKFRGLGKEALIVAVFDDSFGAALTGLEADVVSSHRDSRDPLAAKVPRDVDRELECAKGNGEKVKKTLPLARARVVSRIVGVEKDLGWMYALQRSLILNSRS